MRRNVFLAVLMLSNGAAGCRDVLGIEPGSLGSGGGGGSGGETLLCPNGVVECPPAEVPECGAYQCEGGECVFEAEPDGVYAAEQTAGDCLAVVCDGKGGIRFEMLATDFEDDGNPCTLDACDGGTPKHTNQAQVPCYTGDWSKVGTGECVAGVQQCDAGQPVGGCVGEKLPQEETCDYPLDEDCDGQSNEGGPGCECVPGEIQTCYGGPADTRGIGSCKDGMQACRPDGTGWGECIGDVLPSEEDCGFAVGDEDCDGTINESGPRCFCGDGFVSVDTGEECDDAGQSTGCDEDCTFPACGDGIFNIGAEWCDDGGQSATCDADCTLPACGDGALNTMAGEECDDGNASSADACSDACTPQDVLAVGAGDAHTCAVLSGGAVKCWGYNYGGLGLGDLVTRLVPPQDKLDLGWVVGQDFAAVALDSDNAHICVILSGGKLKCWGDNGYGKLGLGDNYHRSDQPGEMGNALPAVDLAGATPVAVSAGLTHTCALLESGKVKCWGNGGNCQLGIGNSSQGNDPGEMATLLEVNLGQDVVATAIGASGWYSCALLEGGKIKCWGSNSSGQLGRGDLGAPGCSLGGMGDALPAVDLGPGITATAIAVGYAHVCALLADGKVKCWGNNTYGQLGLGDTENRGDELGEMGDALLPVNLGEDLTAVAITAGGLHTCALLASGAVKCWGRNDQGQLGLGDTEPRGDEMGDALAAVSLGDGPTAASAVMAGHEHTCALVGARLKCWGRNDQGQLGLGDTENRGDQQGEMGGALPFIHLFNAEW